MNDKAKGFDRMAPVRVKPEIAEERRAGEGERLAAMLRAAMPPAAMRAAPVAPARGTMRLVENWEVAVGGTRRLDGAHWAAPSALDVENVLAREKRAEGAIDRAEDKAGRPLTDADVEAVLRRAVDLFTPGQVAIADRYRALVEWRDGSAIKCASLEAGRGGGSGDYLTAYMDAGDELAKMVRAIGDDVCLSPRRHMDRGNGRGPVTVRQAVDGVVLRGLTISALLKHYGWVAKGETRKVVRTAISGALDRMQGYKLGVPAK